MNGRILFLTSHNVTLQWDHPIDSVCNLIHQIVNCSYLNSSLEITMYTPVQEVAIENLKPFTKYICYSAFFNKRGYSEKSDEIIFWTKLQGKYYYYYYYLGIIIGIIKLTILYNDYI